MAGLDADPEFRLSGLERRLLSALKVPEAPEPPDGSPDSIRVFRAGRQYYLWLVIMWASGAVLAGFVASSLSIPLVIAIRRAPEWVRIAAGVALLLLWSTYVAAAVVTLISRRLNYGLR